MSKYKWQGSVLSFHCVVSEDYPLSNLSGSSLEIKISPSLLVYIEEKEIRK